jgi:hypothetical protein
MESSADDRLWPDASVRRNTPAKQMTPFGVFREGWGRATVMHLPSKKAGLMHGSPAQWQELESWIGQERRYGAKLVH